MGKVSLRNAYSWTCEECGRDNFENLVIDEHQNELTDELIHSLGEQIKDSGVEFSKIAVSQGRAPQEVKCKYCREEFETEF